MSDQLAAIGPALRLLRQVRGLWQNVTAERGGITKAMLSAYEGGKRRPSLGTLDRILAVLGVRLLDLAHAVDRTERRR